MRDWNLAANEQFVADQIATKSPELVEPLLTMFRAFDRLRRQTSVSRAELAPLVAALRSSRRPLYENACELLRPLTVNHAAARDAVVELSQAKQAHVRFNAILCLDKQGPPDFCTKIIRDGLRDKSVRVSRKAADWALRLRLASVIPDLEQAVAADPDGQGRKGIQQYYLPLLRDGYILEDRGAEGFLLTVLGDFGLSGRFVSREEFARIGLKATMDALRQQANRMRSST